MSGKVVCKAMGVFIGQAARAKYLPAAYNGQGDTIALTDANGSIAATYKYDPGEI